MCSIIGFGGTPRKGQWRQTHRVLHELFVASVARGRDATGFAALTAPLQGKRRQRVVTEKQPVAADLFVATSGTWAGLPRSSLLIGHARRATCGEPEDNANNHPHRSDNGRFSLVHNGHLPGHRHEAARHRLCLSTDCDSELLLRIVEAARHPVKGLYACLDQVSGSLAVALLDAKHRTIYLARNERSPLWLCRLRGDNRLFFASLPEFLGAALQRVLGDECAERVETLLPLPSGVVVALGEDGSLIACDEPPRRPSRQTLPKKS